MGYAEFRRHLGKAGMTINNFAAYLGVRPASVSNHAKEAAVPRSYALLAVLLGDMADRGIPPQEVLSRYGLHQLVNGRPNVQQLDMFRAERGAKGKNVKPMKMNRSAGPRTSMPRDGVSGD